VHKAGDSGLLRRGFDTLELQWLQQKFSWSVYPPTFLGLLYSSTKLLLGGDPRRQPHHCKDQPFL